MRLAKGLTLHSLAEKSGVNYMKIHQLEVGKIKPENLTLRVACKLAAALDCMPEELMK